MDENDSVLSRRTANGRRIEIERDDEERKKKKYRMWGKEKEEKLVKEKKEVKR